MLEKDDLLIDMPVILLNLARFYDTVTARTLRRNSHRKIDKSQL